MIATLRTENELVAEYAERTRSYAHSLGWYLPGADRDDLEQEALVGLLHAIRSYRPERRVPFWPTYARLCIRRWLVSALCRDNRERARVLTGAERTGRNEYDDVVAITDLVPDPRADLERILEGRRELRAVLEALPLLTELERRAAIGKLAGYSYGESGDPKQIDNALVRAREKLRRAA